MLCTYLILFLTIIAHSQLSFATDGFKIGLFDFAKVGHQSEGEPYTLDKIVVNSIESGLEVRKKLLELYVARKNMHIHALHLLPEINIYAAAQAGIDRAASLEALVPLVGFLLPSRWFNLHASRHLKKAEEHSLASIMGNSAQHVQNLYLDIQRQIWLISVLEFYSHELDRFIKFFQDERERGLIRVSEGDIQALKNMQGRFLSDRAFVDGLSASIPKLAAAMGFSPEIDWSELPVEAMQIKTLGDVYKRHYSEFWELAYERSTELATVRELITAAHSQRRALYLDPLDPDSGNNLGLMMAPRIKSTRTNVLLLINKLKQTAIQLGTAIQDELNNYNDAVDSLSALKESLESLHGMKKEIEKKLNNRYSPIDFNKVIRLLEYSEITATDYIKYYFSLKEAEAKLNRLTWNGEIYKIVNDYRENEIPKMLKEIRKEQSLRHRIKRKVKKIIPSCLEATHENRVLDFSSACMPEHALRSCRQRIMEQQPLFNHAAK